MDVGGVETIVLAVAGGILPPIISWLKGKNWNPYMKTGFSIVVSFVVAAVVLAVTGGIDLSSAEFWASASVTWSVSQVVYQAYFKNTVTNEALENQKVLG